MKTSLMLPALLLLLAMGTQSCLKDSCERTVTYIRLDPVYKTVEEVHNTSVTREAPRELVTPGQINYYDNKMFIVEKAEGVHVIDNSNPANPINTDFLNVPGITDLAIKDGYLYVNSFIDLLVINLQNYVVESRTQNVLQPNWYSPISNQIIVDYTETEVTEVMSCEEQSQLIYIDGIAFKDVAFMNSFQSANASAGAPQASSGVGIGGSLSHFTIISDYLYTIQHDGYYLEIYDITQPTAPTHASTVDVGVHLETLFPYGDKLFVGSNVGMYIYDNSDPLHPVQLSVFEHARACDPVFVNDHYAYVTLWDGSACGAGPNQLDVIDITDLTNPVLVKSFSMLNPHGLSVKEDRLLLCEGTYGLEVYDNTNPATVGNHLLGKADNFNAVDVISLPGNADIAMVIGDDGFYQFDFSNPDDLKLLSVIRVKQ